MAILNINIKNTYYSMPTVKVNGNNVKLCKDKYNNYVASVAVDEAANIEVSKFYELESSMWALYCLIVWIVGIIGLFSGGFETKCFKYNYTTVVNCTNDTTLKLVMKRCVDGGKVIDFSEATYLDNDTNIYCERKDLAKRAKIYNAFRILTLLLAIGIAIYCIIK